MGVNKNGSGADLGEVRRQSGRRDRAWQWLGGMPCQGRRAGTGASYSGGPIIHLPFGRIPIQGLAFGSGSPSWPKPGPLRLDVSRYRWRLCCDFFGRIGISVPVGVHLHESSVAFTQATCSIPGSVMAAAKSLSSVELLSPPGLVELVSSVEGVSSSSSRRR